VDIIRVAETPADRRARFLALISDMRNAYKILVGGPKVNKLFGMSGLEENGNIRMKLKEIRILLILSLV
jgi:predicted aminopeptidase